MVQNVSVTRFMRLVSSSNCRQLGKSENLQNPKRWADFKFSPIFFLIFHKIPYKSSPVILLSSFSI